MRSFLSPYVEMESGATAAQSGHSISTAMNDVGSSVAAITI